MEPTTTPAPSLLAQLQAAQDDETLHLQTAGALTGSHAPAHEVKQAFNRVERARAEKNRLTHLIAANKPREQD